MKATIDGVTYEGSEDEIRRIVENPPHRPPFQSPDGQIKFINQPMIGYRWAWSGEPPEPIPCDLATAGRKRNSGEKVALGGLVIELSDNPEDNKWIPPFMASMNEWLDKVSRPRPDRADSHGKEAE